MQEGSPFEWNYLQMSHIKNFALIGAAGYIAPRHMNAIKETGHRLVAALDKSDSVGIIDNYFPDADFFTEFERFDRHIERLRRTNNDRQIHYVSIASPNYLHDAHIRFALRVGANAICEKPLVLNSHNLNPLKELEQEFGKRVYSVLQLRLHPAIRALKDRIEADRSGRTYSIDLTYITGRGRWYYYSWKGDEDKSGGIATNIGVHFFDILTWIFGDVKDNLVHIRTFDRAAGFLELERARVRWFLSLRSEDVPTAIRESGKRTYRCLQIDGEDFEFTEGFNELHTAIYKDILEGRGFGIDDSAKSIHVVQRIREIEPQPMSGPRHPYLKSGGETFHDR